MSSKAMAGSTDQEDFSFPIITETTHPPPSIDSPPLWQHLSPAASPGQYYYKQRKSCSYIETSNYYSNTEDKDEDEDEEDEEEDKMDMLWEDYFNEEVSNLEGNNNNKRNDKNSNIKSAAAAAAAGDTMELGCVQALNKLSKKGNNGAIFSSAHKKPSFVVFIKVLKKLFLLRNSSHHNHR